MSTLGAFSPTSLLVRRRITGVVRNSGFSDVGGNVEEALLAVSQCVHSLTHLSPLPMQAWQHDLPNATQAVGCFPQGLYQQVDEQDDAEDDGQDLRFAEERLEDDLDLKLHALCDQQVWAQLLASEVDFKGTRRLHTSGLWTQMLGRTSTICPIGCCHRATLRCFGSKLVSRARTLSLVCFWMAFIFNRVSFRHEV